MSYTHTKIRSHTEPLAWCEFSRGVGPRRYILPGYDKPHGYHLDGATLVEYMGLREYEDGNVVLYVVHASGVTDRIGDMTRLSYLTVANAAKPEPKRSHPSVHVDRGEAE